MTNLDVLTFLLTAAISGASGYLMSYLKNKGQNKALKEDIEEIEKAKKAIEFEYQQKIEDLKKKHSHDFEIKKHQYESKKQEYYSFMDKLDSFNANTMNIIANDLKEIMMNYLGATFAANTGQCTIDFNEKALNAIQKFKSKESELFSQVNRLKLSSSERVDKQLSALLNELSKSRCYFEKCINYISNPESLFSNPNIESLFINSDCNLEEARIKLLNVMKDDLNNF